MQRLLKSDPEMQIRGGNRPMLKNITSHINAINERQYS